MPAAAPSPTKGGDDAATGTRNAAHRELVAELLAFLAGTGHRFAVGTSTVGGKRPDAASISTTGQLVIWEAKTRFVALERQQAWEKYHRSCDLLVLVYPATLDISGWRPPSFIPAHPSAARCGVLLLSNGRWLLRQPPTQLKPEATAILHLTQSVLRLSGSPAPNTSVRGSS